VDFAFAYLRQLANVTVGLSNVIEACGFCGIADEFVEAVEYPAQLGQSLDGAMCSLWEFEAFLSSKQSLYEAVQLISTN
jgi:hypothetical protein